MALLVCARFAALTLAVATLLAVAARPAAAFTFDLEARRWRCFVEELPGNIDVVANFAALPGYAQFVDFKITDPLNNLIWSEEGSDKAEFKMTTAHGGDYAFCFYSRMVSGVSVTDGMKRVVSFDLKTGAETHNYEALATKTHMKPMEVQLRIMEDSIRTIHAEYTYFKEREIDLRNTNEYINTRAMWATIAIMTFAGLFAWWQARHLKNYFRRKRVID